MEPTVLVAATSQWFPTARLAMALAKAGCAVEAVCPAQHPLSKVKAVRRMHPFSGLTPVSSLGSAIVKANPTLIIPGDDLATHYLHRLYQNEEARGQQGLKICEVIERSLGVRENFPILYQRATFMRLAQEEGIRTPKTAIIQNLGDLRNWTAESGFPTVLKADGTSGGEGVRMVCTPDEAIQAYQKLKSPPLLARAVKRAMLDGDKTLVWPSLLRRRSEVSAQSFIAGHEATSLVACWEGVVLAALHFEVVNKRDVAGPATVMRLVENADMVTATDRMVRRLKLSGIHGFDFMLEGQTGKAYLIEINPRATQIGHLTLGPGRDLPAALKAVLTSDAIRYAPKPTESDVVVLFPQEWMRDPESAFIRSEYHDVPWEEPELVQACIEYARKYHGSASRRNERQFLSQALPKNIPALIKPELNKSRHD
jgi:hypothetical protein